MPTASALRLQIEKSLENRFPSALTPVSQTICEMASTGIDEVDELLDGGLPVGAISEITGPASSGRSSLALAFLAQRTAEDRVCAWVDTSDAFDPESAAASEVSLRQLLWVRCSEISLPASRANKRTWTRLDQALRATDLLLQAAGFAAIVLDLGDVASEHARRIPLATWFRFRHGADRTRCSLIVLGKSTYAQSSAAVALECEAIQPETYPQQIETCPSTTRKKEVFKGKPQWESRQAGGAVLRGFTYKLQRGQRRFSSISIGMRKPPSSTWLASSAWSADCDQYAGCGGQGAEKRA